MESRKKHTLLAGIGIVAFSIAPAFADISGHTDLSNPGIPPGFNAWTATNNWAVLSPGSALIAVLNAAVFTPGTGSGGWAVPAGSYVYLYQETNDAGSTALHNFTNSLGLPNNAFPVSPSTYGQFGGLVMADAGGNVSPSNDLDAGGLTAINALGGLTAASSVTLSATSYIANWPSVGGLLSNSTGSLFAFVSPYPPGTFVGSLQNGGNAIGGGSPAPTVIPEPAAVVLGLIGLAPLAWRRRIA